MPRKLNPKYRGLVRYGGALAAVGIGMLVRLALTAWVGPGLATYITFYPAVMAVALLGGLGPGIVATAATALVTDYWILPPHGFGVERLVDAVGLVLFLGMGLFMSVIAELYRRNQFKAAAYDREVALRESQTRLATFAEATFEGIVESEAGRIVDCNEQFARMLGYSVVELRGMEIASLIAPEDRDRVMANIQPGRESLIEHAMQRKDGMRIVIEAHGRLLFPGSAKRHTAVRDISERKRAETERERLLLQYQAVLDSLKEGVSLSDPAGNILLMNRAALALYQLEPAEQVRPLSYFTETFECFDLQGLLLPVSDWPRARVLRGETISDCELRVRRKDTGHWFIASFNGTPVRSKSGAIQLGVLTARDITARKQAEEAVQRLNAELRQRIAELQAVNEEVRASRRAALNLMDDAVRARKQAEQANAALRTAAEQRRLALEAADLGAWDYHFQTGEVFWDERCREMWGIPQAEKIEYAGAIAAIHPEDQAAVDEAVTRALAGKSGGAYQREFRVVWPDGSVHWIASHGRVYFQGEGDQRRAVRFIGTNLEITAEKQAAEAVRQSEERYRTLVELSPEGVFVNRNNRIVLVNRAALELFGASSTEQLLGKSPFEVFHPDCHAIMRDRISQLLAGQPAPVVEEKILRLDGGVVSVEVVASPVMDQGERAILVLLRDITERKRAEAALLQTTEELKRSNRDLEQFAYVASHDLQEPLRAVGGYVKLLEHRFPDKLDDKARAYVAGAFEGASRMERLITDLLAFSRVGTRGGSFVPCALDTVLEQALLNLETSIKSAQAKITHDPLPTLAVDATQIMQLFQNLIGNALKFHGASPPQIHVGAQRQEGRWVFSVRDNGIGIEPQYFERIFDIFQRLHTRKDYAGTGIGLAICKKIAERHGGAIWVESRPGQGSTFSFSIPEAAAR